MQNSNFLAGPAHDRRRFLRLAAGFSAGALLSGCGGGGGGGGVASQAIAVVAAPAATPATAAVATGSGQAPLNLALTLAYVGANYYGMAARGAALASALTGGVGRAGAASGGRQASLADAVVSGHAADLADDKQAHVVTLRGQLGALSAAQPAIDLSAAGAFSVAAQGAGIVAAGGMFDPYASDANFLLGAFLIENAVAAAYRTLLAQAADAATASVLAPQLADAIYHGGLVRALLADRAGSDVSIDRALTGASTLLATLDGTDTGDQTLAGANGASSNILDAEGRPIPFTRTAAQVLKGLYLSSSGVGGFLPAGANGIA